MYYLIYMCLLKQAMTCPAQVLFEQGKVGNFEFEISMDDVKIWFGDGQFMHMCALHILRY